MSCGGVAVGFELAVVFDVAAAVADTLQLSTTVVEPGAVAVLA